MIRTSNSIIGVDIIYLGNLIIDDGQIIDPISVNYTPRGSVEKCKWRQIPFFNKWTDR